MSFEPTKEAPAPITKVVPKMSAVVLLVRAIGPNRDPYLIFIRRTEKVYTHKGQISFPGGGYKPADGTLQEAALRETEEELGIDPASLRVLGPLPPVETIVTNFVVYPFVAVPVEPAAPITYVPDDFEVASVLEMPLRHLIHPDNRRDEEWVIGGQPRPVMFYSYGHNIIWGATAYILQNFIHEINQGQWNELFEL